MSDTRIWDLESLGFCPCASDVGAVETLPKPRARPPRGQAHPWHLGCRKPLLLFGRAVGGIFRRRETDEGLSRRGPAEGCPWPLATHLPTVAGAGVLMTPSSLHPSSMGPISGVGRRRHAKALDLSQTARRESTPIAGPRFCRAAGPCSSPFGPGPASMRRRLRCCHSRQAGC